MTKNETDTISNLLHGSTAVFMDMKIVKATMVSNCKVVSQRSRRLLLCRLNKSEKLSDLQDELSVLSKDIDQVLRRNSLPSHQALLPPFPIQHGSRGPPTQNLEAVSGLPSSSAQMASLGPTRQREDGQEYLQDMASIEQALLLANRSRDAERGTALMTQQRRPPRAPGHPLRSSVRLAFGPSQRLPESALDTAERPLPLNGTEAQPLQTETRGASGAAHNFQSEGRQRQNRHRTANDAEGRVCLLHFRFPEPYSVFCIQFSSTKLHVSFVDCR